MSLFRERQQYLELQNLNFNKVDSTAALSFF